MNDSTVNRPTSWSSKDRSWRLPSTASLVDLLGRLLVLALCGGVLVAAEPSSAASNTPRYYYAVPPANPPQTIATDVCVYGDTPAGITAAIQAARMGKTASLVVFGTHIGGMTTSGLSATDGGKTAGGIAAEFYEAVGKSKFLPSEAEKQFRAMLDQAGVKVYFEHRLASVAKEGPAIREIVMENGNRFRAKVFVDATYEGDLMAMAKVSYTVGREGSAKYTEPNNGIQMPNNHNFSECVDPYVIPGDEKSGLLPEINRVGPIEPLGSGDKRVQAYNFRMYLAKMPDAIPFPKPKDYDPKRYELLRRYINIGTPPVSTRRFMQLKVGDSNNQGGFSTDHIGASDRWPEASYAEREKIFQDHVSYQQGFMYFLANDPGVPDDIRTAVSGFGLAKGAFDETGGWPHQMYVREARRMVSDYVMTGHNCLYEVIAGDSVGLAEYGMDAHNAQRFTSPSPNGARVWNEGNIQWPVPHPYPVAYRALVPKPSECTNLLAPVCLSASHVAYGSIRMEPVFMVLGQSAGTAACIAIDGKTSVQGVPYPLLQARLLADHQNLAWDGKEKASAKKRSGNETGKSGQPSPTGEQSDAQ